MKERDTDFRNPKHVRLTVAVVYLTHYKKNDDQGLIAKARAMLDEHNLELDLWPDDGQKYSYNTLDFGPNPIAHDDDVYRKLRAAVDAKIKQGGCTFVIPLPVIFCTFVYPGHGITPHAMKTLTHACLIDMAVNDDKVTMIHEMGHAVPLYHQDGDSNRGNFMHEAEPRSNMYRFQVERLAKAAFSVG